MTHERDGAAAFETFWEDFDKQYDKEVSDDAECAISDKDIAKIFWQASLDYAMRARISGPSDEAYEKEKKRAAIMFTAEPVHNYFSEVGFEHGVRWYRSNLKIEPPVGVDELPDWLKHHACLTGDCSCEIQQDCDRKVFSDVDEWLQDHVRRKLEGNEALKNR